MSQLPPPPPPPAPAPGTVVSEGKGLKRGQKALVVGAVLLLLAAAGAAAVVFIPSVGALAGISSAAPSSPVAVPPPATGSPTPSPTDASPSATATRTFEMAPQITSAPPVPETPSATATPTASAAPGRSSLDLGLAVPVNIVPCNGQYLTFYASAINPSTYAAEIQAALNKYPGSSYLATEGSCSALNQVSRNNTRIYGVYSGPHATAAIACQALAGVPGAYVKVMNPSTDPESQVACS